MIKNIIFDFDGTLADTAPLIVVTMDATARELGLPAKTDSEYRSSIGLRLDEIPQFLWPANHIQGEVFATAYSRIFEDIKQYYTVRCFPFVSETLRQLKDLGFGLAIASSRSHRSLDEFISDYGFDSVFDIVVGGDDVGKCKPEPDAVFEICRKTGWQPAECLVVGDTTFDILMGQNAGSATCAVSYGNQSASQLAEASPNLTVNSAASIVPLVCGVNPALVDYVENNILPSYRNFDKAHREDHANMVIFQSMSLARHMPRIDIDMIYAVAAFHDLGLKNGRENHHIDSGTILSSDAYILNYFTAGQVKLMKEAVEDHRASGKNTPRNEYGLVVAEADRFIDPETIIRRTIRYGLANYPSLDREGHFNRTLSHLVEKYGPEGYLKIHLPWSGNVERLKKLHGIIADNKAIRSIFNRIFDEENNHTVVSL